MAFLEDGYLITNLSKPELVIEARHRVKAILGALDYYPGDRQDSHLTAQKSLGELPRRIIESECDLFRSLLGGDIHIQKEAYLRISRPFIESDNIGFHRDTWYGDSPYELSVWIPLTDVDEMNCLKVAPGSHVWPEDETKTQVVEGVPKGSDKHKMGFLYSPKRLVKPVPMKSLPVKLGQMIVFSLSLLHGQEVNRSNKTRVSFDVRLANSLAPIKWERSRGEYYEPLFESPVTKQAKRYYANNTK